jgi:glycosyl-4,4'-diaponeurosporenoate acyltransferase
VFELSGIQLIAVNSVAWLAIQLGVGFLCQRIPESMLDHRLWLFRSRAWERRGALYQRIFRVRRWKSLLPSGGKMLGGSFSLRQVKSPDGIYLERWVLESCRAELTHWLAMAPVVLFFVWNPIVGDIVNVLYALAANVPCILAQRYNRPRLLGILDRQLSGAR